MNVCVVKEDKVVRIDGEGMNFDFDLPSNVWAIQWNGTSGEIEFNDGTPNEAITDFSAYQYLIDGHATEKQRLADENASRVVSFEELRDTRDSLLSDSDWTQLTDTFLSDSEKQEWVTYRQELRDLPNGYEPTNNPVYPSVPGTLA